MSRCVRPTATDPSRYSASVRICLLTTQDLDADPFPEDDWPCDPRPFMPEAEWHVATLVGKVNSVRQVEQLTDLRH